MYESRKTKLMKQENEDVSNKEEQANIKRHATFLAQMAQIERKTKIESSRAYGDQLMA